MRLTETAMVSVVSSGSTNAGSVKRVWKLASVGLRGAIGEGEHDEPADRQDDQQAQHGGEQRHHRAGQVESGRCDIRGRRWQHLDGQRSGRLAVEGQRLQAQRSHLEISRVARLDVVGLLLDRGGVVLHQLDRR